MDFGLGLRIIHEDAICLCLDGKFRPAHNFDRIKLQNSPIIASFNRKDLTSQRDFDRVLENYHDFHMGTHSRLGKHVSLDLIHNSFADLRADSASLREKALDACKTIDLENQANKTYIECLKRLTLEVVHSSTDSNKWKSENVAKIAKEIELKLSPSEIANAAITKLEPKKGYRNILDIAISKVFAADNKLMPYKPVTEERKAELEEQIKGSLIKNELYYILAQEGFQILVGCNSKSFFTRSKSISGLSFDNGIFVKNRDDYAENSSKNYDSGIKSSTVAHEVRHQLEKRYGNLSSDPEFKKAAYKDLELDSAKTALRSIRAEADTVMNYAKASQPSELFVVALEYRDSLIELGETKESANSKCREAFPNSFNYIESFDEIISLANTSSKMNMSPQPEIQAGSVKSAVISGRAV